MPGVKGRELALESCSRIRSLAGLLEREGLRSQVLFVADGGIRSHTVPQLREAGADARESAQVDQCPIFPLKRVGDEAID